ncbi:MAG: thiamine phosphate synthase [Candidatus Omnitrophica bacterium]|nr:thiamine phosphate synthase [Candidatus Omnitrophota bacterium]MCM8828002.1 thiamine phosphate synthase [Candidatus Omnitrophota bacterium]
MKQVNILRIIDANFNRVREAIRVVEDILRFSETSAQLTSKLREIRHFLTSSYIKHFGFSAIVFRNVRKDPGKNNAPHPALDVRQIMIRNFLRAEEGLRCIEECSRIAKPSSTESWQKLRFAIYQIEQQALIEIPDRTIHTPFLAVYAAETMVELIHKTAIKLETKKTFIMIIPPAAERTDNFVRTLRRLRKIDERTILLVQDRPDIALAAGIDGVHLEYGSISACDARRILPGKIIGITLKKNQKLRISEEKTVNYIACEDISKIKQLLTKRRKNIKLYAAAILNSCREIEKAIRSGIDGAIIKPNAGRKMKINEICKIVENFYGKET